MSHTRVKPVCRRPVKRARRPVAALESVNGEEQPDVIPVHRGRRKVAEA